MTTETNRTLTTLTTPRRRSIHGILDSLYSAPCVYNLSNVHCPYCESGPSLNQKPKITQTPFENAFTELRGFMDDD